VLELVEDFGVAVLPAALALRIEADFRRWEARPGSRSI
jgi:hypothetical protein